MNKGISVGGAYVDKQINRALETIRKNIKVSAKESLGYYELKKHKPWFDEGCSKLLAQGHKPNCSGFKIPAKERGRISTV
jgi:hypothetical protein